MKGLGSLNENKIQGKQPKVEKENLSQFDCSNYTNGKSGTIGEKHYEKIFCLDNKMKLAKIYKILHDKENYNKDVAFILNSDLDFSGGGLDYVSLNNNLNLTDYKTGQDTFLPIGGDGKKTAGGENEFNADFYGNNHKIIVGDINYSDEDNIGFFGVIGSSGKVYNLKLEIGNVNGKEKVGGFIGYNDSGTIENSSVVVNSVNGDSKGVGGFVGWNDEGTIENSSVVVNSVNGDSKGVGGFVGWNIGGTIENSSVSVKSVSGSSEDIGGFVGYHYKGTIKKSSAVVDSVKGESYVGGFVGENNNGTISNSSAVVKSVSGIKENVGGFVGRNYGTIDNSSAVIDTTSGSSEDVGGFVGNNDSGIIKNSVARVLVLNDTSSNVSAGYYSYNDSGNYTTGTTNTTNFDKAEFFFGDTITDSENKGLSYD